MLEVEDSRNCRPSCRPILTMVLRRQGMWSPCGTQRGKWDHPSFSRDTSTTYIWGSKLATSIIHCLLKYNLPTPIWDWKSLPGFLISYDIFWSLSSDSHPFNSGSHPAEVRTPNATAQPLWKSTEDDLRKERALTHRAFYGWLWAQYQRIPHKKKSSFWTAYLPTLPCKIIHISYIYHPFIQFNIPHIISPHPWMVAMKKYTFLDFLVPINLPRVSGAEQPAENSADSSGWDAGALSAAMKMDRYQLGFKWLLIHVESPKLPLFSMGFWWCWIPKMGHCHFFTVDMIHTISKPEIWPSL